MVRPATRGLTLRVTLIVALAVTVLGCASRSPAGARSTEAAKADLAAETQRLMACLDLRDHIVALYADRYVEEQGLDMSMDERAAFHRGWAEELAKSGTFESFEKTCFSSLTPRKYECGMASHTTDGLVACMKLSSRD